MNHCYRIVCFFLAYIVFSAIPVMAQENSQTPSASQSKAESSKTSSAESEKQAALQAYANSLNQHAPIAISEGMSLNRIVIEKDTMVLYAGVNKELTSDMKDISPKDMQIIEQTLCSMRSFRMVIDDGISVKMVFNDKNNQTLAIINITQKTCAGVPTAALTRIELETAAKAINKIAPIAIDEHIALIAVSLQKDDVFTYHAQINDAELAKNLQQESAQLFLGTFFTQYTCKDSIARQILDSDYPIAFNFIGPDKKPIFSHVTRKKDCQP